MSYDPAKDFPRHSVPLFGLARLGTRIDFFRRKQFAQRCLAVSQYGGAARISGEIVRLVRIKRPLME
jgi:hypothetical protein